MILKEENTREDAILDVAKKMMAAARTAPKARGIDNIEACVIGGVMARRLAVEMRVMAESTGMGFFNRDAANIDDASFIVLIGARMNNMELNCGLCGYPTCSDKDDQNPETPCSFVNINLGIAVGSAVSVAADHRIDNRVLFSAGMAAKNLDLLPGCHAILAIPLSCTAKSPYFDRQ